MNSRENLKIIVSSFLVILTILFGVYIFTFRNEISNKIYEISKKPENEKKVERLVIDSPAGKLEDFEKQDSEKRLAEEKKEVPEDKARYDFLDSKMKDTYDAPVIEKSVQNKEKSGIDPVRKKEELLADDSSEKRVNDLEAIAESSEKKGVKKTAPRKKLNKYSKKKKKRSIKKNIHRRISGLERRISRMEKKLGINSKKNTSLEKRIKRLERKMKNLE